MKELDYLYSFLPVDGVINWDKIKVGILNKFYISMEQTEQEYKWHAEGNVFIHTKMVCEELIKFDEYKKLNKRKQLELFLAALFHDVGKTVCTKVIDGELRSFNHGIIGSNIVREFLWKECNLSGNSDLQNVRETICLLIKYHSNPIYVGKDENVKRVIKLSLNNKLASDYNLYMLYILSKADVLGRIAIDTNEQLEYLHTFKLIAEDLDILHTAYCFKNNYTKFQYFLNNNIWHEQELYDTTYGEVILLCGLPGTGKDTYIKNNFPNIPVVSLDDIRITLDIKPNDEQGLVYNTCREIAKEYLRNKETFIWNATNISELVRSKQIKLFHDYHAKVRIIFLEANWKENLSRNRSRKKEVMEGVISNMLSKLTLPEEYEAEFVEWKCV